MGQKSVFHRLHSGISGIKRRIRTAYYARLVSSIGTNCQICSGALLTDAHNISLGNRVIINNGAVVQSCLGATITIGDRVNISYGAKLITGGLDYTQRHEKVHKASAIRIDNNVWIGANALILPGVHIGENVVIAAGSVVTKNVVPNTLVAGVPAKIIKHLDSAASE